MAKTYFILRNLSYQPSGIIDLGRIVSSPKCPDQPLNPTDIPPAVNLNVEVYVENDWKRTVKKHRHGHVGIWAKFLEGFIFGGEASISYDSMEAQEYSFKQLETRSFRPSEQLLQDCLHHPSVHRYIKKHNFSKPVYMITGVKFATGASITEKDGKEWKTRFAVGASVASPAIDLGPDAGASSLSSDTTSSRRDASFVFAYRLTEIYYEKSTITTRDVGRGHLYSVAEDLENDAQVPEIKVTGFGTEDVGVESELVIDEDDAQEPEAKVTGFGTDDVGAKSEPGLHSELVIDEDGDEECECISIALE